MMLLWWLAGFAVLLAITIVTVLSAGIKVQILYDGKFERITADVSTCGVGLFKIKAFVCDNKLYYQIGKGRLKEAVFQCRKESRKLNAEVIRKANIPLRRINVNLYAAAEDGADTAIMCTLARNIIDGALSAADGVVRVKRAASVVYPDYSGENTRMNISAEIGWGILKIPVIIMKAQSGRRVT